MIDVRELKIGDYLLCDNANIKDKNIKQICKVFHIDGERNCASVQKLSGKGFLSCFDLRSNKIFKFQIEEDDPYTFPSNPVDCNLLYPFPLADEILLACGFKDRTLYFNGDGSIDILIEAQEAHVFNRSIGMLSIEADTGKVILNMKYLHQLQNLYFDLTGEELEIHL